MVLELGCLKLRNDNIFDQGSPQGNNLIHDGINQRKFLAICSYSQ